MKQVTSVIEPSSARATAPGSMDSTLRRLLAPVDALPPAEAMTRRLDLEADRPEPEHAQHRNVTMIPARGARVVVRARTK